VNRQELAPYQETPTSKRFASEASLPRRRKPAVRIDGEGFANRSRCKKLARHLSGVGSLSLLRRHPGVSARREGSGLTKSGYFVWLFSKSVAEKIHVVTTGTKGAENH